MPIADGLRLSLQCGGLVSEPSVEECEKLIAKNEGRPFSDLVANYLRRQKTPGNTLNPQPQSL
jgi:hypothetical protein